MPYEPPPLFIDRALASLALRLQEPEGIPILLLCESAWAMIPTAKKILLEP